MSYSSITPRQRVAAVGALKGEKQQRIFNPSPIENFFDLPAPDSGEWLKEHEETAQSVSDLLASEGNIPDTKRNIIYLLPLGNFPDGTSPPLDMLREYVEVFYGNTLHVELLTPVDISAENITTRINQYSKQKQMLTKDVFTVLKKKIPENAYCLLGITMIDLYPKPEWNFVFGQASIHNRYGVFSFARYNPSFYGDEMEGVELQNTIFKRSCRVCAHEIGHMFGVTHCVYYDCLMSGSNHLEESEAKPLHLCPVDLRKFQTLCKFDPVVRYEKMVEFYRRFGSLFEEEITWITKMLQYIHEGEAK